MYTHNEEGYAHNKERYAHNNEGYAHNEGDLPVLLCVPIITSEFISYWGNVSLAVTGFKPRDKLSGVNQ